MTRNIRKPRGLFNDLDDSPSHLQRDITLIFFKGKTEEGSAFIAVPLTSSTSRSSRFPKFSGSSSSFEQPDKMRVFRDVIVQVASVRLERFLQFLRLKKVRPIKCSTDDGNSSIAVSFKYNSVKCDIFPTISGNFFNFEQPDRVRVFKKIQLQQTPRLERFLQSFRLKKVRLVKFCADAGNSFIAVLSKSSFDKHDIFPTISGNFFSLEQPERSKTSRDSILILGGRISRHLQPFKSNLISHLRFPRDG